MSDLTPGAKAERDERARIVKLLTEKRVGVLADLADFRRDGLTGCALEASIAAEVLHDAIAAIQGDDNAG